MTIGSTELLNRAKVESFKGMCQIALAFEVDYTKTKRCATLSCEILVMPSEFVHLVIGISALGNVWLKQFIW